MVRNVLRALWDEPRPSRPPARVWRDWGLVAIVVLWSAVEALFRADLAWRPVKLSAVLLVALALLWRRTHPLAAVAVALGVLTVLDLA